MLRALLPGRPTLDCLFSNVLLDDASLLKVCILTCPHRCLAMSQACNTDMQHSSARRHCTCSSSASCGGSGICVLHANGLAMRTATVQVLRGVWSLSEAGFQGFSSHVM